MIPVVFSSLMFEKLYEGFWLVFNIVGTVKYSHVHYDLSIDHSAPIFFFFWVFPY